MSKHNSIGLGLVLVVAAASLLWLATRSAQPSSPSTPSANQVAQNSDSPTQSTPFNKDLYSIDDPTSRWVVVNKLRPLPDGYAPSDLTTPNVKLRGSTGSEEMMMRAEAASAIESLFAAAGEAGHELIVASAYRSQTYQAAVYGSFVRTLGQEEADRSSARPGHSEHQTGWAIDVGAASGVCEIEQCFGEMAEGMWVAENAVNFGFLIRYQQNREAETGYIYEPWHLRYVGQELAKELQRTNQTLEQFFGLPSPDRYE